MWVNKQLLQFLREAGSAQSRQRRRSIDKGMMGSLIVTAIVGGRSDPLIDRQNC
jgi:hypothetical protein